MTLLPLVLVDMTLSGPSPPQPLIVLAWMAPPWYLITRFGNYVACPGTTNDALGRVPGPWSTTVFRHAVSTHHLVTSVGCDKVDAAAAEDEQAGPLAIDLKVISPRLRLGAHDRKLMSVDRH